MDGSQGMEKFINSPVNLRPEVRSAFSLPRRVLIHDVTLRDGEQTPHVVLTLEEKVRIAQALDDLGVARIEAGMPIVSSEDREAIRKLAGLGLNAEVLCLCRARREDIDAALECDVDGIVTDTLGNPRTIKAVFGWDEDEAIRNIVEVHRYAKEHGLYTSMMPVDSLRADPAFIERLYKACVRDAKVDSVVVCDTFGMSLPQATMLRVREVREWVGPGVSVELHIHNDFGLATANALAAVSAGAEIVHTSMNNLGERAGNAATEEVAVGLQLLLGVDAGIKLDRLMSVSRLVQDLTGVRVSPTKPIVGDNDFTFESGLVVYMWKSCKDAGFELGVLPFMPDVVGREPVRVVIGKKSGATAIGWKLKEMGISLPEKQLRELVEAVKDESIRRKYSVTEEELKQMAGRAQRPP
ncbi:MAG: hypothetical protein QW057_03645 [Candidatus Bathyarchaeia archaeon]